MFFLFFGKRKGREHTLARSQFCSFVFFCQLSLSLSLSLFSLSLSLFSLSSLLSLLSPSLSLAGACASHPLPNSSSDQPPPAQQQRQQRRAKAAAASTRPLSSSPPLSPRAWRCLTSCPSLASGCVFPFALQTMR